MTSAFNSGIFKTLVEANQRSCDLINSFVGSFDFNRNKSNTLQELKEQTFHTKLYINIQNTLPFIKHNIPKAYCELSYENIVLWIQRALYRINVATFIRFLELDNIYNAGKFSLHHICYEEETRSNDVQAAFVDLRTRLLATLVADEIDTSSNENTSIEMSPLMERTLPLDGSAFGLYPEEDDDFILELLKQRHEMITTLPDSDALDALVTADNLINVWKVAIIASMYRMPALELPPGFPPNQSNDDVYIKQEDVLTDVYSDAQEYQYSQDRHLSQVYQLSQEGESYESNTHGNTPIKQEDDDNYNGIAAQQYGSTTFTTPCDSGDDSDHSYQGVEYLPNPVLATHILPGDDPEFFEGDRYVLASPSLTEHDLPGDDDNDFEGDQYHLARPSFAENGLPDNVEKDDENGQSHLYEPPEDSNYCEDQLGTLDEQNKHPDTNINTDTDTDTDTNINITITINSDSITNSNTNTMNVHSTDKAGDGSEGGGILEENDDDAGNQLEESEADHDHGSVGTHTPIIDWNRHLAPSTAISDPFSDSEIGHDLEDNDDNNEFDLFPAAHEDDYAADVNNMYETTSPWNFDDATEFDINQQYTMVDEIAGDDDIDTPSEMPTKADDTVTIDTHTTAIDNSSSSQAHMDSTSVHGISNQLESSPVDTHLATEAQNDDEGADDLVDEYEDVDNRVEASAEALENDDLTTTSPTLAGAHVAGNDASDSDEDLIDELENDDDDDSEYQLDPDEMDDSSSTNNSYIETTGGEGEGENSNQDVDHQFEASADTKENDVDIASKIHAATSDSDGTRSISTGEDRQPKMVDETEKDGDRDNRSAKSGSPEENADHLGLPNVALRTGDWAKVTGNNSKEEVDELEQEDSEDDMHIANVNTTTIPAVSQQTKIGHTTASGNDTFPVDTTGATRKRKMELEGEGSSSVTKETETSDSAVASSQQAGVADGQQYASMNESAPPTVKKRRVLPFSKTSYTPATPEAPSTPDSHSPPRATTVQPMARQFAKRSGPPPVNKISQQSTSGSATSTQHMSRNAPETINNNTNNNPNVVEKKPLKRQWHERREGQPPPTIITWDDDDEEEQESDVDENANLHSSVESNSNNVTRKRRRTMPAVPESSPGTFPSIRYQPPLTYRQRQQQLRQQQHEQQAQEAERREQMRQLEEQVRQQQRLLRRREEELRRTVKIEAPCRNASHLRYQAQQRTRQPVKAEPLSSPPSSSSPSPSSSSPSSSRSTGPALSSPSSSSSSRSTPRPNVAPVVKNKTYTKWSSDEVEALNEGLQYYRGRQWRNILTKYAHRFAPGRTNVDLRDKARNEIKSRNSRGQELGGFEYAL